MKKSVFKISVIASLLLILFSTSSCGIGLIVRGAVKSSLSVEKKTVPPNFIDNKEVLLVLLSGENSYDDYVKKAFEKFYDGKKEFVTFEQYFSCKYNDVNKFAYVFSQGRERKKCTQENHIPSPTKDRVLFTFTIVKMKNSTEVKSIQVFSHA